MMIVSRNSSPPLSVLHIFQDCQWMPEPMDSTNPYGYYGFSYTHIPMLKFSLQIRHSKRNKGYLSTSTGILGQLI